MLKLNQINLGSVIIIKLGGSAITDKLKEFKLNREIIKNTLLEIKQSNQKIILIHGGGSFAHNIAQKYKLANGIDSSLDLEKQLDAISWVRKSMRELNLAILDEGQKLNLKLFPICISSTVISNGKLDIQSSYFETINHCLESNFIPVLNGDIIFDIQSKFRVISGDRIIKLVYSTLKDKIHIPLVIFGSNVDGLYDADPNLNSNAKLISDLKYEMFDNAIKSAGSSNGFDVTGGMKGKLEEIKGIVDFGVPVKIINLLEKNRLLKTLKNEFTISTTIYPREN